ncbi:hypothetical protein BBO99_00009504 [Phytophthora kernoviae]|uniref:Uncharacterized protein n=1 Tax=Phytophthora kernoviae TaxID=325452 RepID=A0A3R7JUH0_9STRA|nr:hypothetical protein JM16_009303 [Phytophthora kernoviae]RLN73228.1 hypothetical protein BBO99_00009504 [Phytophthora kernoviae]
MIASSDSTLVARSLRTGPRDTDTKHRLLTAEATDEESTLDEERAKKSGGGGRVKVRGTLRKWTSGTSGIPLLSKIRAKIASSTYTSWYKANLKPKDVNKILDLDIAKVEVYEKMGVEYQDLCDPYMLEQDEELFYGFWGSCTNSYRDTEHHRGYQILRKWRDIIRSKDSANSDSSQDEKRTAFRAAFDRLRKCEALPANLSVDLVTNDPFFVYTSNVDAHFHRDFDKKEVYELHGSVETWQCAGDVETGAREPCEKLWKLPAGYRFDLDVVAMRAPGGAPTTCPSCGGKGRPNVLMFHDRQWIANIDEEDGYIAWESVMELMLQDDPSLNLVVLEIGCGLRVPSVRRETEMVVADVIEGCGRPQATLIRINPDIPECDNPVILANGRFLSIPTKGLEALEGIDQELANLRKSV